MKCRKCEGELTKDVKRGCLVCMRCNPPIKFVPQEKKETNYVDVPWTEEKIRELVRDEIENWHIPRLKDEAGGLMPTEIVVTPEPELTWRQKAKALGIRTSQRKKVDVLADIKEKESTVVEDSDLTPSEIGQ